MAAELAIIAKLQDEASSGIRALRGEIESLGDSGGIAAKGFQSLQTVGATALTAIAAAAIAAGAALGGFIVDSVSKAAALEAQMDTVAALLGATAEQAELLRQATIDLALDPNLMVSATEAAQAIEMLAQNGLTVEQILGGAAEATVQLANATGADFTIAARIATDAMALWGMEASQLGQVADGVTAVLVQSKFEVNDYALALAQAGGVAAAVGVSFDDFNATLVAIAPYFASGSDAGTSYKTMLQRLIPTTTAAKDAMAALGLITEQGSSAFFDSQGNMRDMAEVAGILNSALSGLTEQQRLQALSTIFGTDAMRAAAAMSQFTEEQFRNLMAVMANTSAAEIAAQRMANFSGAMDIVRGVIEGLQLQIGNVLLPILTQLALAAANLMAAWGPPIIAVFENFVQNLQEGMSVIDAFIEAIWDIAPEPVLNALIAFRDSILPIIQNVAQAITSFVSWKDVLIALGIAIGSVVIPVLWGIIQVVAPIVAVFGGLILAIAAVRTAFETNFLGIRDLALNLWSALQGVFEGIKALLQGDTTAAMAAFRSAWETGWSAIVGFIQNAGAQIGQALQSLWQSIVAWFQGIDWGALGQLLVERFLAGMAALGQARADLWEWILTSLTNFIQAVDWGQLGYTLIDLLIKGIVGAIGLIGTALAGLVTFIWNFITGTNWIELGINLVSAIVQGLYSFAQGAAAALADWRQVIFDWAGAEDWSGVGEHVAGMVGEALGAARDAIGAKLSEWQTAIFDWAGAEDWQGVAEHIAEGVGEKLGEAKDAVVSQLSEWQTAIFDWAEAEDWQGVAEHIAETVGEKLGEAGEAISSQLSEWQTAIFDWADAEDWDGVAEHIAEMVGEKLGEAGDAVSSQLSEWQTAIFDWADAEDWQGVAEHIAEMVGESLGEAADAIASQLSEWQTAIFDWADAEDWTGVATHIAEMVGEALGGAADTIISTLDSWEQAIFDWAGAADWVGVSESIAGSIGDSLADVSDKVTDKLSGWITAFTDWVESVDWYQVGYDIMFNITDAFLDFKATVTEKISTWLADTQAATEGYAWYEVGAYILLQIVESAAGAVQDWVGTVGAWISNIGSAITHHLANLAQVGRDLVAGIAAGISAAGDLIAGAIAGVTAGAEPAARAASQSQSPSRLMMPVGYDLSAGIAVGITQGAGTIISAVQQVAGQMELEAVKAFSEAVKAIGEAIESAVRSYVLLSGFSGADTGGAAAGLASIVLLMQGMVDAFVEANSHAAEALELVGNFADAAGAIVDLIADSLLPLSILASIDTSFLRSGNLADGLAALRDFLIALVAAFADAAAELGVLGSLIESFTGAAESVVGLVEDALSAAAMLAGFNFGAVVQGWHLQQQIVTFRDIVRTMVREFADAALEFAFMSEAVQMFTGAAESVIGLVEDGLRASMMLSGFNFGAAVQGWHLRDQIIVFRNIVQTMVREFADAALEFGFMGEAVTAFTEAAEGVIGLVEEGLHAVMLLSGFNFGAAVQGWHLQQQIIIFRNIVRTMVREFAEAALEFGAMADSVSAFAEAAEGVIGLVEEGLAAAVMLSEIDFGSVVQGWHLAGQIEIFRNIIRTLIREFAEAAAEFGTMAESVEAFADAADAVLGLVIEGIEAIQALSETDFGALVQGWHLAGQIEIFRNIIRTLIREFSEAATEFGSMAESVEAFADAAGAVVDLVEPAIEAIGLLANYSADTGALSAALQQFIADLVALTLALASGFQQVEAQIGESVESAAEFAERVNDLIDVVEPGIEALAAIAQYETVAGIRVMATAFAQQLIAVIIEIATAFASAATTAGTAVAQAAVFADSAESILDVVEPGIEALAAIATYFPIAGIRTQALAFGMQLVAVLVELASAFVQAATNAGAVVAQAVVFAENAADILDVVEPGIEALTALATYVSATGAAAAVQTFAGDLVTVVVALVDAFQQAGLLANQAVVEAGEMAGALEDIVSVVEPAVEAVVFLVGYTTVGGLQTNAQQFAADLVIVIQTLVDGLAQAGLLASQAVTEAGEMAKHIQDILKVVEPALHKDNGAITLISRYVSDGGLVQKAQQFTSDLITVTQILIDGLTTSSLAAGVALQKAGEMAKSLEDLFKAIVPAIGSIGNIAAYTSEANLAQKTQQFTNDLILVATILVTGLTQAANQLSAEAVSAAHAFAQSVSLMVARIQAIVESLNTLGTLATPNIQPKLDYLITSAQQIAAAAQQSGVVAQAGAQMAVFRDNVRQLVDEVIGALAELARLMAANAPGSVQQVLSQMLAAFQNQAGAFTGAGATIANNVMTGWRSADWDGSGQYAVDQIAAGVSSASPMLTGAVNALIQAILNQARAFVADFGDVGRDLVEAAAAGMAAGAGAVQTAALDAVESAIGAATNAANAADAVGDQFIDSVVSAIDGGRNVVIGAVVDLVGDAIDAGANAARSADEVGEELVDAIEQGIDSGAASIKGATEHLIADAIAAGRNAAKAASAIGQDLVSAAVGALNSGRSTLDSAGSSAGNAVIDGMARSITSGKSRVVNAIVDTVQAAINAAKSQLGISSPSRVFGMIAAQTIEGFVRVFQASRDITSSVSQAMDAAVGAATERLTRARLDVAMEQPVTSGASPNIPFTARPAAAGASTAFAGRSGPVNIYGNIVLHNVSDARSFLEELDALRGGGQ